MVAPVADGDPGQAEQDTMVFRGSEGPSVLWWAISEHLQRSIGVTAVVFNKELILWRNSSWMGYESPNQRHVSEDLLVLAQRSSKG